MPGGLYTQQHRSHGGRRLQRGRQYMHPTRAPGAGLCNPGKRCFHCSFKHLRHRKHRLNADAQCTTDVLHRAVWCRLQQCMHRRRVLRARARHQMLDQHRGHVVWTRRRAKRRGLCGMPRRLRQRQPLDRRVHALRRQHDAQRRQDGLRVCGGVFPQHRDRRMRAVRGGHLQGRRRRRRLCRVRCE